MYTHKEEINIFSYKGHRALPQDPSFLESQMSVCVYVCVHFACTWLTLRAARTIYTISPFRECRGPPLREETRWVAGRTVKDSWIIGMPCPAATTLETEGAVWREQLSVTGLNRFTVPPSGPRPTYSQLVMEALRPGPASSSFTWTSPKPPLCRSHETKLHSGVRL